MSTNGPIKILSGALTNGPATNDIRAIHAPVEIPGEWTWLWWTLAGLAVLGLLVWLTVRWIRKQAKQTLTEIVIPPHEKARLRLERALALIHEPYPFCSEVSDTIRAYLEERFNFRAPERTTEEFLQELQSTTRLIPPQKTRLGEFLGQCDLVKFARHEPTQAELRELHASAVRLVSETEPRPLPTAGSHPVGQSVSA